MSAEGHLCLRRLTWGASPHRPPTPSDLGQGKSGLPGPGTNRLFFCKEQSTKRWGGAQGLEEQQWAGPRPWRRPQEALVAFSGVKRRPR